MKTTGLKRNLRLLSRRLQKQFEDAQKAQENAESQLALERRTSSSYQQEITREKLATESTRANSLEKDKHTSLATIQKR